MSSAPRVTCSAFKQLGTVADYTGLLDVLSQFQTWKQHVMGPICHDLQSSYQSLTATNRLLLNLSEMVKNTVATQQFDDLVDKVESQLQLLDRHVKSVRGAPEKLTAFKDKIMQRMMKLKNDYTRAMQAVDSVVNPCRAPVKPVRKPVKKPVRPRKKVPRRHPRKLKTKKRHRRKKCKTRKKQHTKKQR